MKKTFLFLVLVFATGCPGNNGTNWDKAAALTDDFAHSVQTAQQIEIQAFHVGKISKEDHVAIEQVFLELGKDGKVLDNAIKTCSSAKDITEAFDATLTIVQNALATADTHIKDPDTKASIDIVLTAAKGTLDTMKALK